MEIKGMTLKRTKKEMMNNIRRMIGALYQFLVIHVI